MREPSGEKRGLWNRGGSFSQPLSRLYYSSKGHGLTPDDLKRPSSLGSHTSHELWPRPFSSTPLIPVQCSGPGRAEGSVLDSYPVLDEPSVLTAEAEAAASPGNRV